MVRILNSLAMSGAVVNSVLAMPADVFPTTTSATTVHTFASAPDATSEPSISITDTAYILGPSEAYPTATSALSHVPVNSAPGFDALPPKADLTALSTITTSATPSISMHQLEVCTKNGILQECGTTPSQTVTNASPSATPSNWDTTKHCSDSSAHSGSSKDTLLRTIQSTCSKPKWNILLDPSLSTLNLPTETMDDGNNATMTIDFHWLGVPYDANNDIIFFNAAACHAGFQIIAVNCGSEDEPLMIGGYVNAEFSGVPVTFFLIVDI